MTPLKIWTSSDGFSVLAREDERVLSDGPHTLVAEILDDDYANVLAAAPKLLEALKVIDAMWSTDYSGPESKLALKRFDDETIAAWKQMRAAIAEAERNQL